MAGVALAAGVLLMVATRHLSFFFDEWNFILGRRGESVGTYLDPHNGHLSLFPIAVYKLLLALTGLRHYWPYLLVLTLLHLACGAILYVIARRRLGPWLAILPAALLLFLGAAYEDLLWPFQIGFLGSMAGGLGALALLDPERRPSQGDTTLVDVAAFVLLAWSLSSSGVGVAFLVAAAALLVAEWANWRRLWVVAVPAGLFVLWYLGWGTSEQTSGQALLGAPQYVADAASAASAAVIGLSVRYGPPLLIASVAAVGARLRWRRVSPGPLLVAAILGALAFWLLTAIARADESPPGSSRYLYIGATFILLVAVDAVGDVRLTMAPIAILGVLVLGAIVANVSLLRTAERGFRTVDVAVRASLGATQVAAPVVAPGFVPDPHGAPQITAGSYLSAVRAFGSPALTVAELQGGPESVSQAADAVLASAERVTAASPAGTPPQGTLTIEMTKAGRLTRQGDCYRFVPAGAADVFDVVVNPGSGLQIGPQASGEVSVYLRRLAPAFAEPPLTKVNRRVSVNFPPDAAPQLPWHVRLTSAEPFTACPA